MATVICLVTYVYYQFSLCKIYLLSTMDSYLLLTAHSYLHTSHIVGLVAIDHLHHILFG